MASNVKHLRCASVYTRNPPNAGLERFNSLDSSGGLQAYIRAGLARFTLSSPASISASSFFRAVIEVAAGIGGIIILLGGAFQPAGKAGSHAGT